MAIDFETLVAQARQLPREQRVRLVDELTRALQRETKSEQLVLEARRAGGSTPEQWLARAKPFHLREREPLMGDEEHECFLEWLAEQRRQALLGGEQRLTRREQTWGEVE